MEGHRERERGSVGGAPDLIMGERGSAAWLTVAWRPSTAAIKRQRPRPVVVCVFFGRRLSPVSAHGVACLAVHLSTLAGNRRRLGLIGTPPRAAAFFFGWGLVDTSGLEIYDAAHPNRMGWFGVVPGFMGCHRVGR